MEEITKRHHFYRGLLLRQFFLPSIKLMAYQMFRLRKGDKSALLRQGLRISSIHLVQSSGKTSHDPISPAFSARVQEFDPSRQPNTQLDCC